MKQQIEIDYEKLCRSLEYRGKSKKELSVEIGREETYICRMKKRKTIHENEEALICKTLGYEPGYFTRQNEEMPQDAGLLILQNIYKEIKAEKERTEELYELVNKTFRKANANTIQLERIKEMFMMQGETEEKKAEKLITELLSTGEKSAQEILTRADEQGIRRSELMKARDKLGVRLFTTNCGKSQKIMWKM